MNKKVIAKISAVFFAFAVVLSVSGLFFTSEVNAASVPSKPARVYTIKAKTNGKAKLTVSWSRVKKASGYQLEYRTAGGKWVKCPRQKDLSVVFKAGDLKYKTYYQFRVRAYKSYKQKEYFNTKTQEWVTKKPAKENLGETREVTKRRYGKYSKLIKIRTDKKPKKSAEKGEGSKPVPVDKSRSFTVYLSKGGKLTINGTAVWRKPSFITSEDIPTEIDVAWEKATFKFKEVTKDKDGNYCPITILALERNAWEKGEDKILAEYKVTVKP